MSLYGGNLLSLEDKVIGAIAVCLPPSLEVGAPFTVLLLSPLQSLHGTPRLDLFIESASVKDGETTISAAHTRYIFKLSIYPDDLDISIQTDLGVLAPCKLARLAIFTSTTYNHRDTQIYAQMSQSEGSSEIMITDVRESSIAAVIVPSNPSNMATFYMLELRPAGQLDIHDCIMKEDSEGALNFRIHHQGDESLTIQGKFRKAYDGIDVCKTQHDDSTSFELRRLIRNPAPTALRASEDPYTTIVNDLDEIVQCTLQESDENPWPAIIEATFGLQMGAVGFLTSIAVAGGPSGGVSVVLAVIGLVLAARGFKSAIKSSSSITACIFPEGAISRQTSSTNDLFVLRVYVHDQAILRISSYRLNNLGGGTQYLSQMLTPSVENEIFNFDIKGGQGISLYRAIKIPNLIPDNLWPGSNESVEDINGKLVVYAVDNSGNTYYDAEDCWNSEGAVVSFKYSTNSCFLMQEPGSQPGFNNKIIQVPNSNLSIVKLSGLSVTETPKKGKYLDRDPDPIRVIVEYTSYWMYVARPSTTTPPGENYKDVTGYTAVDGTYVRPDPNADLYFIIRDWIPYQAIGPVQNE